MKWRISIFIAWLGVWVVMLLISGCTEKAPLEIKNYSPPYPKQGETFLMRDKLKSDGSFQTGYFNGTIRSDRIVLEWLPYQGDDFLSYKIFRNGALIKTIVEAEASSFIDSGLVQNTYYDYKMSVLNQSGMARIDTIRLKTPRFLPPSQFDYKMVDSTTVLLFWENSAESATKFRVYRRLFSDTSSRLVGTVSDTFFTDSDVINGQSYYYQVEAFNDWESTGRSSPYFLQVNYQMNAPFLFQPRQVAGTRSVRLSWNDNSNAEDGFNIYRRRFQETDFRLIGSVPMGVTEYVDNDTLNALEYDSTFVYAVTAYNAAEETPFSNWRSITITRPLSPGRFVEIGTGTISWNYPFRTFYHDARTQVLYLASEIGRSMTIRKVALNVTTLPGQTMNNFVIRMKHTSINSYPSNNFDNTDYTICYNQALTIDSTGWIEIPLTTPFNYNGMDNLIIDISFNNDSYTSDGRCYATDTGVYRSITFRSDSGAGDDPLNYSQGTRSTYIPNIRLYY